MTETLRKKLEGTEEHSEGPWYAQKDVVYWFPFGGTVEDGYKFIGTTFVGDAGVSAEERYANARLMAAAPTLLAEVLMLREQNDQLRRELGR